nr:hypothetical protein BaRGS_009918 [Batillaria attramentaria]
MMTTTMMMMMMMMTTVAAEVMVMGMVMKMHKRFDFLPNYKNPCWIDWTGQLQRLRCLPYFHLLGVDKSGTTDLHSRIAQHPHILYNNGGIGKETYFWCWLKYGQWMTRASTPKTFFNYLRAFDKPTAHIANTTDSRGFHYLITGDGTPMDFWDFRAWPLIPQNKGLKEPVVLTPHLMKHVYPDPKFIVILRDPVNRLYSDYVFLGYGLSPEKFRIDVPRALDMMEKCLKINTTRQCVFSNDTYVNLPMRLHIGMYSVFMKEWLAVFPRDRFYILRTEDYQANMKEHLRRIYKFLDVGQWMRRTVTPKTFFNYLRAFDKPSAHIANTTDSRGFHYLITGDGTPMDFWDFRAWPLIPQNKGEGHRDSIRASHGYPCVFVASPWLYSDYVFLGYGLSPEKFRIDVPRALDMMEKCLKINTTRQCVFSNDTYVNLPMRLHIGMYSVFMKEWLAVFPRDRFYILRTEDYQANMKEHLRRIYKFLDVGIRSTQNNNAKKPVKLSLTLTTFCYDYYY